MSGARRAARGVAVFLSAVLLAPRALAVDDDVEFGARLELHEARAEYEQKRYDEGAERLEAAVESCGRKRCSPKLKAMLLMDLGAFEHHRGNEEGAREHFRNARALAPDLPFAHDHEKDVAAAWNAATKRAETDDGLDAPATVTEADGPPTRATSRKWARLWVGVSGTFELLPLPAAADLCRLSPSGAPVNDVGAYCTNPDGTDFPSRSGSEENDRLVPGSGKLPAGLTPGNVRLLLTFDYTVLPTLQLGARLGYTLNAYPGDEAPGGFPVLDRNLHAELRATYLFGAGATATTGFVPLAFVSAGASEFDGHLRSTAALAGIAGQRPVTVWVVRGPWFLTVGMGARYLFSPRVAFTAALRLNSVFGEASAAIVPGPELGVAYGF